MSLIFARRLPQRLGPSPNLKARLQTGVGLAAVSLQVNPYIDAKAQSGAGVVTATLQVVTIHNINATAQTGVGIADPCDLSSPHAIDGRAQTGVGNVNAALSLLFDLDMTGQTGSATNAVELNEFANVLIDATGQEGEATNVVDVTVTPYAQTAMSFDGQTIYVRGGDLTGATNSKTVAFSGWFDPTTDGVQQTFIRSYDAAPGTNANVRTRIQKLAGNAFGIACENAAGTVILNAQTSNNVMEAADGKVHIAFSCDLSSTSLRHMYVNGVADSGVVWTTYTNDTIQHAANQWTVGGTQLDSELMYVGNMYDVWFDDSYIDLSVVGNLRKFIRADGTPAYLGDNGENPTGSSPLLYLSGGPTNLGTGGGFTSFRDDGNATVGISGTATQGQLMTASFANNDPDGTASSITYQWVRGASTDIAGATASTYTLQAGDVGSTVKVRVGYVDADGFKESIESSNSATVASSFTPTTNTYDSGSGNETTPTGYTTLVVEIWGAGAGGQGAANAGRTAGTAGGASSCSTLGLTANGGTCAADAPGSASTGGTASGGDTNTTGGSSGSGSLGGPSCTGVGWGGSSPTGGGAQVAASCTATIGFTSNGNQGNAPGGGGSGTTQVINSAGANVRQSAGGSGGGYTKKTYTFGVTPGAPAYGASLAYVVGTGGPGGSSTLTGGAGRNGRVKFAWT